MLIPLKSLKYIKKIKVLDEKLLIKLSNCRLMTGNCLVDDILIINNGKIIDPEHTFYVEKRIADIEINCDGNIVTPGFIDVQINGGFGVDFLTDLENITENLNFLSEKLLYYGVTGFCPTITSSEPSTYSKLIPKIEKTNDVPGASILGIHLEGPFINKNKAGAHDVSMIQTFKNGIKSIEEVYGVSINELIKNCAIITLAPELDPNGTITRYLTSNGLIVSMGHSEANYDQAKQCIRSGASFITHLYNAMPTFHHRSSGFFDVISNFYKHEVYYGVITDLVHTSKTAINMAFQANYGNMIITTDGISLMGLDPDTAERSKDKKYELRREKVKSKEVEIYSAYIKDTETLGGSVATMDNCVRNVLLSTNCTVNQALRCASEHPAKLLGIFPQKGSLQYGSDADILIVDDNLNLHAIFLNGKIVTRYIAGVDFVFD